MNKQEMAVCVKDVSQEILAELHIESNKDQNNQTKVVTIFEYLNQEYRLPFLKFNHLRKEQEWKKIDIHYKGKLLNLPERDQEKVVKESLHMLEKQGSCYIAVYCGFGKTHLGSYLCSKLGYQTLILSHRKMISNAWNETIQQMFGVEPITFEQHIKGKYSPVVVGSAIKVAKTDPKLLSCFGTVIVDEVLYFCTPQHIKAILHTTPKYLIGMCAEWKRQDGLHRMLPYFFGDKKDYIIRINKKPFHVFKYQTDIKPPMKFQRWTGQLDWNAIVEHLSTHTQRNQAIANLCSIFKKNKILILCKRKLQCDIIHELLQKMGENSTTLYGTKDSFYSSRILISTYSKVSVGFDDKNTCIDFDGQRLDFLILASDTENVEQSVGRVMRTADVPRIIDIVDDFSSLAKHWKKREEFYKTRNGLIHEESIMFK